MKVRLLDYADREYWVEIPDDTEYIEGEIISGDMVLAKPIFFDTGDNEQCKRTMNFLWQIQSFYQRIREIQLNKNRLRCV